MIDRIREQIQQRLDQLTGEADKLRKALAALDPRTPKAAARKSPARKPPAQRAAEATATKAATSQTKPTPPRRTGPSAAPSRRRTAPGATRSTILAALTSGEAMTAGQVAESTGLARAAVSTTLSRLAKTGEVQKAERGYRLAPAGDSAPSPAPASTPPTE